MIKVLLDTMRPPFLLLAAVCAGLGIALAQRQLAAHHQALSWHTAAWVLLGAVAAHIAVNMLNEWHDFHSGLDQQTQRTPFSGGSGALPAHPDMARAVLGVALVALLLAAGVGVALLIGGLGVAVVDRPSLLMLGLLGVALVISYTPWITRKPWVCLASPGLGFGPVMVLGTLVALGGRIDGQAFMVALVPGCLVSGLLLLNQFPDIDADRRVGRMTLPMLLGPQRALRWYRALVLAAYLALVTAIGMLGAPVWAGLGLLTSPLAVKAWRQSGRAVSGGDKRIGSDSDAAATMDVDALLPALAANVGLTLLTVALVAVGIVLGSASLTRL